MYYEINVAKKREYRGSLSATYQYVHLFATAKRSLTDRESTIKLLQEFTEKFPEPEYAITVSYHEENFEGWTAKEFLDENVE